MLAIVVYTVTADIIAAKRVVEKYLSIQRFCANSGYRKTFEKDVAELLGFSVDIITSE